MLCFSCCSVHIELGQNLPPVELAAGTICCLQLKDMNLCGALSVQNTLAPPYTDTLVKGGPRIRGLRHVLSRLHVQTSRVPCSITASVECRVGLGGSSSALQRAFKTVRRHHLTCLLRAPPGICLFSRYNLIPGVVGCWSCTSSPLSGELAQRLVGPQRVCQLHLLLTPSAPTAYR